MVMGIDMRKTRQKRFRHAAVAAVVCLVGLALTATSAASAPAGFDGTLGRLLDTREKGKAKLVANVPYEIPGPILPASPGAPPNAYSLNLTIVDPTADGFATVHPCDQVAGSTSSVNFRSGKTVANAIPIVPLATLGSRRGGVCVTSTVATHAVIDLTAIYFPDRSGAPVGVAPSRLYDSRSGGAARLAPMTKQRIPLAATSGVIGVTLVVTQPGTAGWAAVQPCNAPVGQTSTLNFETGETVTNLAFVRVEAGVCVVSSAASHVIVDLVASESPAAKLDSAPPRRLLDTRDQIAWVGAGGTAKLSVGTTRTAILNVTAVDPTGPGFVTVWPCSQPISTTSALSWSGVFTTATAVVANADASGDVCLRPSVGTHLVVDLLGFDVAPPRSVATVVTGRTNEWQIGESSQGRPITARAYGTPGGIPVLGVGMIHGDEQWGLGMVAKLKAMTVPAGRTMWLIDSVNPDGQILDIRQNARGVDLNRNYPTNWQPIARANNYSGPSAASEPETQAVLTFLTRVSPIASVWWHQVGDYVDDSRSSVGRPDLEDVYVATAIIGFDDAPCLGFCGGTATQHLNRVLPGTTHFVVETPSPLSVAGVQRHANAFVAMMAAI
jgi:murein peptide amidase A